MNNPFSISDNKLKILLKSYLEWIKNTPNEEDYFDVRKQLTQYLKETLLNKKYLGKISKDQLAKEIFAYSRKLEGPVFIRLGMPRITSNTEKIRNILLYLIDSPDDPIKKASEILSGKYRISIFSKAFWTPIFQAQYPKILPNWNNKTERFLKIVGVDLKTTKKTTEEKYRLISDAFVYLTQLNPDQDFDTLNHLMHYGTMIPEGKEIIKELVGKERPEQGVVTSPQISYWRIIEPLDTHDRAVWPGCKENKLIAIGYEDNVGPDVQKMRDKIKIGDRVIVYLEKGRVGGIGTIIGDYEDYIISKPKNKDYFDGNFWRRRKVRWDYLPTGQDYWQLLPPYSKNIPGRRQTIFQLTQEQFNKIMSLIGILQPTPGITKVKILKEIFLEEEKFDQVINLLENSNKKQIILQGPPGTGKTFIAQRLALYLAQSEYRVETIQFHPSYSYEDFIEGYRPTKDRGFELEEGIFKQFCLKARSDQQNKYVLIIDEINRGNLAKIFGELLYLLEYRKEEVKLTYSKEPFSIPENIYLIGTMNTADRSLAIMDYALRRRFYFLTLACQTQRLASWLKENGCKCDIEDLINRLEKLNKRIGEEMRSSDFTIGHSYFMKKNLNSQILKKIITFEVNPLLDEYFYDNSEKASELKKVLVDYAE